MATKKSILAEAIADAKELKQIAFENAKAAMNETFAPELKKMVNASLREELDEEYSEENSEVDEEGKDEYPGSEEDHGEKKDPQDEVKKKSSEEGKKKSSEESKGDEDGDFNLDELIAELNSEEESSEGSEIDEKKKSSEEGEESEEMDEESKDDESDSPAGKHDDVEYQAYLKLKKKFEPEVKEEEASEEGEGDEYDIDEDSVEAIIRELEAGEDKKYGKSEEDGKPMDEKKYASAEDGKGKPLDEKKEKSSEEEMKKEYVQLKKDLNETNLLNAKLLYFTKIVKENDNMSKSEKLSLLKQFDKAANVKEVKLIHSTISESLNAGKAKANKVKKQIKENTGLASKAAGNSTGKKKDDTNILNENSMYNRFQILAGLKKVD